MAARTRCRNCLPAFHIDGKRKSLKSESHSSFQSSSDTSRSYGANLGKEGELPSGMRAMDPSRSRWPRKVGFHPMEVSGFFKYPSRSNEGNPDPLPFLRDAYSRQQFIAKKSNDFYIQHLSRLFHEIRPPGTRGEAHRSTRAGHKESPMTFPQNKIRLLLACDCFSLRQFAENALLEFGKTRNLLPARDWTSLQVPVLLESYLRRNVSGNAFGAQNITQDPLFSLGRPT